MLKFSLDTIGLEHLEQDQEEQTLKPPQSGLGSTTQRMSSGRMATVLESSARSISAKAILFQGLRATILGAAASVTSGVTLSQRRAENKM